MQVSPKGLPCHARLLGAHSQRGGTFSARALLPVPSCPRPLARPLSHDTARKSKSLLPCAIDCGSKDACATACWMGWRDFEWSGVEGWVGAGRVAIGSQMEYVGIQCTR